MKEDAKEEAKRWYRRLFDVLYRHTGVVVFAVVAAVLAIGWVMADTEGANPVGTLVFPVLIGSFCGLCAVRKWSAWLAFTLLLLVVGVVAALQLILGPPFPGQFRVSFLTLVVYATLGVIIGAIFQLVSLVHRVSHDLEIKLPVEKK